MESSLMTANIYDLAWAYAGIAVNPNKDNIGTAMAILVAAAKRGQTEELTQLVAGIMKKVG